MKDGLKELALLSHKRTITLVYGAADEEHNQALVLKEILEQLNRRGSKCPSRLASWRFRHEPLMNNNVG
ncbi:MAG: hypothetical protein NTNFB02_14320 [Nitrospira sp.]